MLHAQSDFTYLLPFSLCVCFHTLSKREKGLLRVSVSDAVDPDSVTRSSCSHKWQKYVDKLVQQKRGQCRVSARAYNDDLMREHQRHRPMKSARRLQLLPIAALPHLPTWCQFCRQKCSKFLGSEFSQSSYVTITLYTRTTIVGNS